jgi:hypothetical protein
MPNHVKTTEKVIFRKAIKESYDTIMSPCPIFIGYQLFLGHYQPFFAVYQPFSQAYLPFFLNYQHSTNHSLQKAD